MSADNTSKSGFKQPRAVRAPVKQLCTSFMTIYLAHFLLTTTKLKAVCNTRPLAPDWIVARLLIAPAGNQ